MTISREEAMAAIISLEIQLRTTDPERMAEADPGGMYWRLLTLARAGAEWMFASEETVARVAEAIREEIVRQYREDERRTFPGGSHYYEETQSPWLIVRAALAALSQKE